MNSKTWVPSVVTVNVAVSRVMAVDWRVLSPRHRLTVCGSLYTRVFRQFLHHSVNVLGAVW